MTDIEYVDFRNLDRTEFMAVLNQARVREHLVSHQKFDRESLENWIQQKEDVNSAIGCRVKGITVNGETAGWCAVQFEDGSYELAIVIDDRFWGIGVAVFREVMGWAAEMGHQEVVLHLLNTRPEYRFLRKKATRVYESTLFGQLYTSYQLPVLQA